MVCRGDDVLGLGIFLDYIIGDRYFVLVYWFEILNRVKLRNSRFILLVYICFIMFFFLFLL